MTSTPWIRLAGLLCIFVTPALWAQGQQTLSKNLLTTSTPLTGEAVEYRLDFSCSSLTSDCGALTITDAIDPALQVTTCQVPPGFTINSCPDGGNLVSISKDTTFQDGDTFTITINTRVSLSTPPGTIIDNTATTTITNGPGGDPDTETDSSPPVTVLGGAPNYEVGKRRVDPVPSVDPALDTDVSYVVELCAVSGVGNVDLLGATLTDTYPAGAVLVFTDGGVDIGGNQIQWDLGDIEIETLYQGQSPDSRQCVSRDLVLRFPSGTFTVGTAIPNTVVGDGTPDDGSPTAFPGPGSDTATVPDTLGPPDPAVSLAKSAADVRSGPGEGPMNWTLNANVSFSNVPVLDLVVHEAIPQLPAGVAPLSISSGQWNSPSTSVSTSSVVATIEVSEAAVAAPADCATVTYPITLDTAIVSPATPVTYDLSVAAPNATCVRWRFSDAGGGPDAPAVPRSWQFTTSPRLVLETENVAGPFPQVVTNCLYSTFTGGAGSIGPVCASANIEDPRPGIDASKSRLDPTGVVPPGTEITYRLSFTHRPGDTTGPTVNPIIADLLPPELEFIRWDAYAGPAGKNDPNLEILPNYLGSGRTLLRFLWDPATPAGAINIDGSSAAGEDNSETFEETIADADMPRMDIIVRVVDGTPPSTFGNVMAYFDRSSNLTSCGTEESEAVGGIDLNGDGDTTDVFCRGSDAITVISAAVLGGAKFVVGDGDPLRPNVDDPTEAPTVVDTFCPGAPNGLTRFPCVAQTDHDAGFDYQLQLVNSGNVPLDDYVLYDVLPDVADTGVGPALVGDMRNSTWRPFLAGPITFNAGASTATPGTVTIEYTTEANPCRNELSDAPPFPAGCVDNYSTVLPGDLTTVTGFRILVPFAGGWGPGETLVFDVPMDAPADAPPSIPGNPALFNPAWNTFAHRADDAGSGIALPAAEPRKVGIILPPAYRLGNLVWIDNDRDGRAENGEPGIANVTVELWADSDASGTVTAADTLVDTTVTNGDGKYEFFNIDAGDYFVLIPDGQNGAGQPLEGLFQTDRQEEADPDGDVDNFDNGVIEIDLGGGNPIGLTSGVLTLGPGNPEPTGETDRDNNNSADEDDLYPDTMSNLTVDFGYWRPFSLGNRVWLDVGSPVGLAGGANNGVIDAGEVGLDGITVRLLTGGGGVYDSDPDTPGTQELTTVTANGGYYLFDLLPSRTYRVEIELPPGSELRSSSGANGGVMTYEPPPDPDAPGGDGVDSDDNGGRFDAVRIRSLPVFIGSGDSPAEPTAEGDLDGSLANPQGVDIDGNPLADNQGNMTVDFGLFDSYSLGNIVWLDDGAGTPANANNGELDLGEAGIDGVAVRLYEDFDTDGVPDGPAIASTTTAGGGFYRFDNLFEGDYIVESDIPPGTRSSDPNAGDPDVDVDDSDDNGAIPAGGAVRSEPVTLGPTGGEPVGGDAESGPGDPGAVDSYSNLTVDFGFVRIFSLGNRVWLDVNNNGVIDSGEPGINDVTVNLYQDSNADGVPDGAALGSRVTVDNGTDDGYYRFDNLLADTYLVEIDASASDTGEPLADLISSTVDAGDPDVDVDDSDDNGTILVSAAVFSDPVTLGPNDDEPLGESDLGSGGQGTIDARGNMTVDFGFFEPLSLGNLVWIDDNNNGAFDPPTEAGVGGVDVELYRDSNANGLFEPGAGDALIGIATTDGNGFYLFLNIGADEYFVAIPSRNFDAAAPLEGHASSTGAQALTGPVEPAPDPDSDTDNVDDGTADAVNGGAVSLPVLVTPNSEPLLESPTASTVAGDDGFATPDNDSNLTVDFGFYPAYSLGNRVWRDDDDSGVIDGAEVGLNGITVSLYVDANDDGNVDGAAIATMATATNGSTDGYYRFDNLPAGSYIVESAIPPNSASSTQDAGDPDADVDDSDDNGVNVLGGVVRSNTVDLGPGLVEPAGESDLGSGDPGNVDARSNLTVDFGFFNTTALVSIGSTVFSDPDDSGTQDTGELGIPGVTVELCQPGPDNLPGTPDDVTVATTTTDGNGNYLFEFLTPADYCVTIPSPPGSFPLSSTPTDPLDNQEDGDDNGDQPGGAGQPIHSPVITLTVDSEPTGAAEGAQGGDQDDADDDNGDMTVDFGLIPTTEIVAIGSTVFFDPDRDGLQGTDEDGISGVRVDLYRPGGDGQIGGGDDFLVASDTTDGDGDYLFPNLPAGVYFVEIPTPPASAPLSTPPTDTQDNQEDGDDNGDQPGGVTTLVRSPLITLMPNTEPVGAQESFQGGNQDNGDDDNGDMTVDFGFVPANYDLALIKQLAVGQSDRVATGDPVTFTITISNQGEAPAANIAVVDYLPPGFELSDAAWTDNGDGSAGILLPPELAVGAQTQVDITLRVTNAALAGDNVNVAEIESFEDVDGNQVPDIDSVPDNNPDNDPGGQPNSPADDEDGGDGTGNVGDGDPAGDEDDADPAVVFVEVFDLAIQKLVPPGQGVFVAGGPVVYDVLVINEGNIDATNVEVTDYIPAELTLNDPTWTDNGDGTASIIIPGPIAAGTSISVSASFLISPSAITGQIINVVEITDASDPTGDPPIDVDSEPDNDPDNDPPDEDDISPVGLPITPEMVPVDNPWALLLLALSLALLGGRAALRQTRSQRTPG
ncbi:MAG: SdrD B-like domain-containing protein [Pseudomonadota bacterium]